MATVSYSTSVDGILKVINRHFAAKAFVYQRLWLICKDKSQYREYMASHLNNILRLWLSWALIGCFSIHQDISKCRVVSTKESESIETQNDFGMNHERQGSNSRDGKKWHQHWPSTVTFFLRSLCRVTPLIFCWYSHCFLCILIKTERTYFKVKMTHNMWSGHRWHKSIFSKHFHWTLQRQRLRHLIYIEQRVLPFLSSIQWDICIPFTPSDWFLLCTDMQEHYVFCKGWQSTGQK